jgi:hypothetical protein
MVSGAKGGGDAIWNYFFPSFKIPLFIKKSRMVPIAYPGRARRFKINKYRTSGIL